MNNLADSVALARVLTISEPAARAWNRAAMAAMASTLVYRLSAAAQCEIEMALDFASANGLSLETIEQEDFRLPGLARDVPALRERLDTGVGFVIMRAIPINHKTDAQADMIAWAIGNYFGRPLRQGISRDRRLFTVTDTGAANTDPTRLGASAARSPMHSDNGCLEPRPPCYIGLLCTRAAASGGQSRLITARTLFATIDRERPELLPLYFERYTFRAPQMHVWPAGQPVVHKPIFEVRHGELQVHYARIMIEPGMEMAGTPLTARQREALDYLDALLEREDLVYEFELEPGDMLIANNLVMLHGREAFEQALGHARTLKRLWLRRRHWGPGDDPVALDLDELAASDGREHG